ncbi:Hypothetical Protein FCC1311_018102 [Hondaea fermentalgiana]|uniref:Cyclic nucleotide-binding domain-containing protein n=1 Tax=Hondaea fermentalgiana TaxID=2315210 RepID=A0A2R5GBU2_9STRA|nr:Hypothetical Protein FCC1311_018102 [Hondaea fermentalgiana]|eukprot:GBG25591.1 Hypothetical Protein FCC1311_018102 [Hondaea fermentalgiana]
MSGNARAPLLDDHDSSYDADDHFEGPDMTQEDVDQSMPPVGARLSSGAAMFGGLSTSPVMSSLRRQPSGSFVANTPLSKSPFAHYLDSAKLRRKPGRGDDAKASAMAGAGRAVAFGCINGAVMIPTMVGFASIIYKDPFYTDEAHNYLPQAIKLVFLSSAIHQVCFVIFSTLPFAVGQVQDAGLIFLSSMAVTIVSNMGNVDNPKDVMTTTVVSLSLCTTVLGLLLIITGKLRLARLIQYLPLPVVGGYLAFIGLFCGLSGLRLTTGARVESVLQLGKLFTGHYMKLLSPCIAATAWLFYISKYAKQNKFALPLSLAAMPILFYVVVFISGHTLQDARDAGWVSHQVDVPPFYEVFSLFDFSRVHWGAAFPQVIPTFFAMFAVVAFGSSLDVAAIQFELGKPMDYDSELVTVGISNTISGMTGGYTGSYIFSQTIFTLRNGIQRRICGLIVAGVEISLFLLPVDLLSVLPRFFFGSVLLFVSVDLLLEWLVHSYFNIEVREYALVWLTFLAINVWGLELGMTLGVILSALLFVYSYSRSSRLEHVDKPVSHAVRSYHDRKILVRYRPRIVALRVLGYQFFGNVIGTILKVQTHVAIRKPVAQQSNAQQRAQQSAQARALDLAVAQQRAQRLQDSLGGNGDGQGLEAVAAGQVSPFSTHSTSSSKDGRHRLRGAAGAVGGNGDNARMKSRTYSDGGTDNGPRSSNLTVASMPGAFSSSKGEMHRLYTPAPNTEMAQNLPPLPEVDTRYVILDMTNASGVDATSARACFLTILQSLNNHDIQLVFAGLTPHMEDVLRTNGVLAPRVSYASSEAGSSFVDPFSASEQSEDDGESIQLDDSGDFAITFQTFDDAVQFCEDRILGAVVQKRQESRDDFFSNSRLKAARSKYFTQVRVAPGGALFQKGERPDRLFVIESGRVSRRDMDRMYSGGSIVGMDDFFLQQNYSYTAQVLGTDATVARTLERAQFDRMSREDPEMALALQDALIKAVIR